MIFSCKHRSSLLIANIQNLKKSLLKIFHRELNRAILGIKPDIKNFEKQIFSCKKLTTLNLNILCKLPVIFLNI